MRTIDRLGLATTVAVIACGIPWKAAWADTAPPLPAAPVAGLAAVAEEGLVSQNPKVCGFDFGSVSKFDGVKLEHVFTFVNSGTSPMKIDHARASCGCTSALIGSDGRPTTLKPGDTVQVKVAIDLSLLEGAIHKSVSLYSDGAGEPLLTVQLSARIEEAVSLSPELIDFGEVKAKSSSSRAFSLTIDARAVPVFSAPGRRWPVLQCSNPDISIVPTQNRHTGEKWIFDYIVQLSGRAPIGAVIGTIGVSPSQLPTNLGEDLQRCTVTLGGEVKGDIAAMPNTVVLGTVTQGHEAGASITVYGDGAIRAADLRIEAASPWIAAILKPIAPGSGVGMLTPGRPAIALLELNLSAKAPLGMLRERVEIATSGGQRLAIPLLCYVVKAYP